MRERCVWAVGIVAAVALGMIPRPAVAGGVPTKVMVRAFARDAKVLHSGVGGARITIRELARGGCWRKESKKGPAEARNF